MRIAFTPKTTTTQSFFALAVASLSLVLAACGGGSGGTTTTTTTTTQTDITSVRVFGDSLADVGAFKGIPTYGRTFTVQDSDSEPNTIWTERIAATYGIAVDSASPSRQAQCNFYQYTGTTFTANLGCTNFAVGGGRINNPASQGGSAAPFSILKQMKDGAALGYSATDLVLIDGGGNDAADLVGAFLRAPSDSGAAWGALLATLGINPSADNLATGNAYMIALANTYTKGIQEDVLAKGAIKVAILNAPSILNTPRFKAVMSSVPAANRPALSAMFEAWTQSFNQQVQANFSTDARVIVVDFYTNFNHQIANPAQYGLTNVTDTACPATGVGPSDGLPIYNFQTCTAAALNASNPGWERYAFSDGFHPTPYGHQLMAQLVSKDLATKGWLK